MKSKTQLLSTLFYLILLFLVACSSEQSNSSPSIQNQPSQPTQGFQSSNTSAPASSTSAQITNNAIEFNSSTASTIPPADILQEVSWYGGGGLGLSTCENPTRGVFRQYKLGQIEPGCVIDVYTCGWQNNEGLNVTVEYPNGYKKSFSTSAGFPTNYTSKYPMVDIPYQLSASDPVGVYKIFVSGSSGEAEDDVSVVSPTSPSVYYYGNQLELRDFKPKENVRFLVYTNNKDGTMTLLRWLDLDVDEMGNKEVLITDSQIANNFMEKYFFVVIGEFSVN